MTKTPTKPDRCPVSYFAYRPDLGATLYRLPACDASRAMSPVELARLFSRAPELRDRLAALVRYWDQVSCECDSPTDYADDCPGCTARALLAELGTAPTP